MTFEITGKTRLIGVMGWPVSHTKSPAMHNPALRAAGIDAVYVPLSVQPEELPEALAGLKALNFIGSNVTIPHKEGIFRLVDELTPEARLIGAVNTIRVEEDGRLTGHNTDCHGVTRAVEADGGTYEGKRVVILGAGGAGRGAAVGAALAGASRIAILNRTPNRAESLAEEFRTNKMLRPGIAWAAGSLDETKELEEADIVLQMTSLGMKESDPLPVSPDRLSPDCHVLEAVYSPSETSFLSQCRSKGLHTTDGFAMLIEQGAAAFEFWFGVEPDKEIMRKAIFPESPV